MFSSSVAQHRYALLVREKNHEAEDNAGSPEDKMCNKAQSFFPLEEYIGQIP